jgi:hypothetical protein
MLNVRPLVCGAMAIATALGLVATSAKADLVFTNLGTGALASWTNVPGSPIYTSLATPSAATTGQGNVAAAAGATNTAMVETFTPSSSFTLGAIAISASGGAQATANVSLHLYDVTNVITSNNGSTTQGSGAIYTPITSALTDLLGGGSGLTFTNPAQGQAQLLFQLTNGATNDQVALTAGHIYTVEVWTPAASNAGFVWFRGANVATDGQMMTATDATKSGTGASAVNANFTTEDARITIASAGQAGGAPRTASLALYQVPEPGTFVLMGIAIPAALALRRRKRSSC